MVDLEDFEYFWQMVICSDEAFVDLVPYSESRFLTFKRAQAWTSGNDIKKGSGIQKLGKTSNKKEISVKKIQQEKVDIDRVANWGQSIQNWQTKIFEGGWGGGGMLSIIFANSWTLPENQFILLFSWTHNNKWGAGGHVGAGQSCCFHTSEQSFLQQVWSIISYKTKEGIQKTRALFVVFHFW